MDGGPCWGCGGGCACPPSGIRIGGRFSGGSDMLEPWGEPRYGSWVDWPWGGGYVYVGCIDGEG